METALLTALSTFQEAQLYQDMLHTDGAWKARIYHQNCIETGKSCCLSKVSSFGDEQLFDVPECESSNSRPAEPLGVDISGISIHCNEARQDMMCCKRNNRY